MPKIMKAYLLHICLFQCLIKKTSNCCVRDSVKGFRLDKYPILPWVVAAVDHKSVKDVLLELIERKITELKKKGHVSKEKNRARMTLF
jgi:hypothetical protein